MFIRVYFNDKPLYLCDAPDNDVKEIIHQEDVVLIEEFSNDTVKEMLHEMRRPSIKAGVFVHQNLEELKQAFWKEFTVVPAGGGLVLNENDEVLMIYRRETWDLPKGKLDEGETMEECALREVKEETGLTDVRLKNKLLVTYHTYRENDETILKESHWYRMKASGDTALIPQTDEQITDIRWASIEEATELAKSSFPSIREVLQSFLHKN